MSKPTGYIVRPRDMKAMQHAVRWANAHNWDNLYEAARTLIGFAEPQQTQQTQLPPVSVASLVLPLNEPVMRAYTDADVAQVKALRSALAQWGVPLDEPVSVPTDPDVAPQPYDMPSPEADALDRIAELVEQAHADSTDARVTWGAYVALADYVSAILRETGRAL